MRQFRLDAVEDLRVRQPSALQLAVAATDELLGRLVEVRQHVEHHAGRLAALERSRADQVVDQVLMDRRSGFEHPLMVLLPVHKCKKSARKRAGSTRYGPAAIEPGGCSGRRPASPQVAPDPGPGPDPDPSDPFRYGGTAGTMQGAVTTAFVAHARITSHGPQRHRSDDRAYRPYRIHRTYRMYRAYGAHRSYWISQAARAPRAPWTGAGGPPSRPSHGPEPPARRKDR